MVDSSLTVKEDGDSPTKEAADLWEKENRDDPATPNKAEG